ncbi:Mitochondrial presequence protease [Coemansia sp. RSA 1287]|nr:Mitochondrial presequence protease [Coemansia sp. RSA 1287]
MGTHSLDSNIERMYALLEELILQTDFTNESRLQALVASMATNMYNDVAGSGHAYARRLAASTLTPEMRAVEALDGLAQVRFLGDMRRSGDLQHVAKQLENVRRVVFDRSTLRTAVTANASGVDANQRALEQMLKAYPSPADSMVEDGPRFEAQTGQYFCPLPVATGYAAQATRCVPFVHPDSVKLQILAKLMTSGFLHREIRERNGAYGGGASYSAIQGIFSFYSYRDPVPCDTLATFTKAVEWIDSHDVLERELREAKLSVFGDLDAPLSAADEGMAGFMSGVSDDMRQERRDGFFAVEAKDLKDVAERYLAGAKHTNAVIGPESLDMSGWTRVQV